MISRSKGLSITIANEFTTGRMMLLGRKNASLCSQETNSSLCDRLMDTLKLGLLDVHLSGEKNVYNLNQGKCNNLNKPHF